MCIKIVTAKEEFSYDMQKPLEEQVRRSKQIIVNYEPADPSIDHFLSQMKAMCEKGSSLKLNIQFNHNDHLRGARLKQQSETASKNFNVNEIVKLMVLMQVNVDNALEKMSEICLNR